MKCIFFIIVLAVVFQVNAQLPKSDEIIGTLLPQIKMTDDQGREFETKNFKGIPTVLVPFYSGCEATCPLAVTKLLESTARSNLDHRKYQVLLYSMDDKEASESLKHFREKSNLPANWLLVRADAVNTGSLFSALNYNYISSNGEYVHPDIIVFISPDLRVSNFVPTNQISPTRIESEISESLKDRPLSAKAGPWILAASIMGLLLSSWMTMHLYLRNRTNGAMKSES